MPRSTNKASKAKTTGKCHVCGDTGHYARDCKERKTDSEEVVVEDTTGKCHVCGETGHYARECKDKKSDNVKVALNAKIGFGTRSNKKAQGWYLNCGSSEHVCYSKDMFVDYNPMKDHEVILDNNSHVGVVGFGTVMLPLTTGKVLTLENVFHAPTITKCFISVVKLTDIGFGVSFGGDECAISKGRNVIGKGYKEGGLYRMSVLEENSGVKVVHDEEISLMVCNESPELTKARARGWVLSTASSVHVCNARDMFVDYHPLNGHEANVVGGGRAEVAGVGTVKLRLATGKVWTLRNVFHMPIIIKCILSLSKLAQSNLITTVSMSDDGCELSNGDELVGTLYEEGGLLRLSLVDERHT